MLKDRRSSLAFGAHLGYSARKQRRQAKMSSIPNDRGSTNSAPENLFVTLFTEVFGLEKVQLLVPQYPVDDIDGVSRFIDFALRTTEEKVAFEIDGLAFHVPDPEAIAKYEGDLIRQNSLIHQGWRVFRWTDRQLAQEPEQVKDQLVLFLERIPGLLTFDEFLPKQRGEVLELRPHQEEALQALEQLRASGKTIALVTHAQSAGKTVTAITDAKQIGGRTLFVVHTKDLASQAREKFCEFWPEATTGLFLDEVRDTEEQNIVGTVQSLSRHLSTFKPDAFVYLVIDEAHHATAETYRQVLGYFQPRFTLGLTATPDRADGQTALEVFQNAAHRLSLREAVEAGELVPIRCVRVRTNVDLSKVRFNQVNYNRKDIEESLIVPGRDQLIVDTYREHVPGRKGVAFCVNVRHGEELAERFRAHDIPARSVSGRMATRERQQHLEQFARGELRVLCACDLLNEGWDCPDVEVLLMARPTLSKVIYLQQLGRGTRKAPGKECLIVFDFVDAATRYNQSLNLHRLLRQGQYRPDAFVLASPEMMQGEQEALAHGQQPTQILPVALWAKDYEEIDVFNWQEVSAGMLSTSELEARLGTAEGRIKGAIERGTVEPDYKLTLGERTYCYFDPEKVEAIRIQLGLPKVDESSIRDLFLAFVARMDMNTSYKPVLLRGILDNADEHGRARVEDVLRSFRDFYCRRRVDGLLVERSNARLSQIDSLSESDIRQLMLTMPFRKFESTQFLKYDRLDLAFLRFNLSLWRQLTAEDLARIRAECERSIAEYYERLSK
jgi:superfamily II DNA or RNA helicase